MSRRLSRERDAISKASSLDWNEARQVETSADVEPLSEVDYESILPSFDTALGSSLEVAAHDPTVYEEVLGSTPVVEDIVVGGKEVNYYSTEQCNQNLVLKAAVSENEELLTTLHQLQQEQVGNARRLLAERNLNRKERVQDYDHGYKWADPSGYDASTLVAELGLNITIPAINAFGEVTHPSLVPVQTTLSTLVEKPQPTASKNAMQSEVEGVMLQYLPDCDAEAVRGTFESVLRLHDLMHTDVLKYIKGELALSGDKMKVLLEELQQAEDDQKEAQRVDNIIKIDGTYQATLATLEKLITCVRGRLGQIKLGGNDTGTYRGKFEMHSKQGEECLKGLRKEKEKLKAHVILDLEKLAAHGEAEAQRNADALASYSAKQRESNLLLADYASQQDVIWKKVEALVGETAKIGDKRAVEVMHHLDLTEKEEKRKREYSEFSEAYTDHCRLMEDMLQHADSALLLLKGFGGYFEKATEVIEGKDFEDEFQEIRVVEYKRYFEFFRQFSLKAADLMCKRKSRLAGIKRLARNSEAQLQLCRDSLDPNQARYKDELLQLSCAEAEVKDQLSDLAARLHVQEQSFTPVEDTLEELGVDFTPPGLENKELESGKRQALLKISKAIVGKEQDEVDKETTDLRKLSTDTKLGRERVLKKRESRKRPV